MLASHLRHGSVGYEVPIAIWSQNASDNFARYGVFGAVMSTSQSRSRRLPAIAWDTGHGGRHRRTYIIYLRAFLDDASRFIMHHRLIRDKRSDICAAVLADVFQLRAPLASSEAMMAVSSRAPP
jgi:hypothetical protein